MRNFIILTLSLILSTVSFGQIIALGQKSSFLHADRLEPVDLWSLVEDACICGHLISYPANKIPTHKKLIVGVSAHPYKTNESLFVIENNFDARYSMQCGKDYVSFYLIEADII